MRRSILILIVMAGLCAVYSLGWFVLAGKAETRLMAELNAAKANGTDISYSSYVKSGFPFSLRVSLEGFHFYSQAGLTLQAPRLDMEATLRHWSHIKIGLPAGGMIAVAAGKTRRAFQISLPDASGALNADSGNLADADLTINHPILSGLIEASGPIMADNATLHLDCSSQPPEDHTKPGGHVALSLANIVLPGQSLPAVGNTISLFSVQATVMGKAPPFNQESLSAWRDGGGSVEVQSLSLRWETVGLDATGTMALDQNLQPIGAFNAKITGFTKILDALAVEKIISARGASMIGAGLDLIARPDSQTKTPTISAPVTVQDRTLYIASFKVMTLPEIRLY